MSKYLLIESRDPFESLDCGLCIDERGVAEAIPGTRRGSPADLWQFVGTSDNTLVIPTK